MSDKSTGGDSAWFAALLDTDGPALVGIDGAGNVVMWTSGAEALFGWTAAEVLGRPPPFIPPALLEEWHVQMQRVLTSGEPTAAAETQRITRDGRSIWVLRSSTPVRGPSGNVIGLIDLLLDMTTLKQTDEESRALAQVRERELIAMDLHDGLIQSLYATVLGLSARQQALGRAQPQAAEALQGARADVERVIEETRGYVFDLRARPFTPRQLLPGLQVIADGLRLNAGLEVQLHFDASIERYLEDETRGHMLFLIREAASNVARHAAATHVWISMARRRDSVIVKVEDDGRGFVDAVERHHGLRNMAERARLIGGRLDVDSRPGAGTSVTLTLPMHTD